MECGVVYAGHFAVIMEWSVLQLPMGQTLRQTTGGLTQVQTVHNDEQVSNVTLLS